MHIRLVDYFGMLEFGNNITYVHHSYLCYIVCLSNFVFVCRIFMFLLKLVLLKFVGLYLEIYIFTSTTEKIYLSANKRYKSAIIRNAAHAKTIKACAQ